MLKNKLVSHPTSFLNVTDPSLQTRHPCRFRLLPAIQSLVCQSHSESLLDEIRGFTFIEVMFSITLGILLCSFLFKMYLTSEQSNQLQHSLQSIQDNATIATQHLSHALHQAGYIGCAKLTDDFPVIAYKNYSITPQNRLVGEGQKFRVRYMESPGVHLTGTMTDQTILFVSSGIHFYSGDIAIISDCGHAEIFQIKSASNIKQGQKIVSVYPLHDQYKQDAELGHFIMNHYFISKTNRVDEKKKPLYALFLRDIHQQTMELVEGADQMKIIYSVNQNGELVDQVSSQISDWSKVVGVAIELFVSSAQIKKTWPLYVALR